MIHSHRQEKTTMLSDYVSQTADTILLKCLRRHHFPGALSSDNCPTPPPHLHRGSPFTARSPHSGVVSMAGSICCYSASSLRTLTRLLCCHLTVLLTHWSWMNAEWFPRRMHFFYFIFWNDIYSLSVFHLNASCVVNTNHPMLPLELVCLPHKQRQFYSSTMFVWLQAALWVFYHWPTWKYHLLLLMIMMMICFVF